MSSETSTASSSPGSSGRSSRTSSNNNSSSSGVGGTSHKFRYSNRKLRTCLSGKKSNSSNSNSKVANAETVLDEAAAARSGTTTSSLADIEGSCLELYMDYLDHYERHDESRHISNLLRTMLEGSSRKNNQQQEGQQKMQQHGADDGIDDDDDTEITITTTMNVPSSFYRFVETLKFLDDHNNNNNNGNNHDRNAHKLTINQFADGVYWPFHDDFNAGSSVYDLDSQKKDEEDDDWQKQLDALWEDHTNEDKGEDDDDVYDDNELEYNQEEGEDRPDHDHVVGGGGNRRRRRNLRKAPTMHQLEQNEKEPKRRHTSRRRRHRLHKTTYDESDLLLLKSAPNYKPLTSFTKVFLPSDGSDVPEPFASPEIPLELQGLEVELHRGTPGIDLKTRASIARREQNSINSQQQQQGQTSVGTSEQDTASNPVVESSSSSASTPSSVLIPMRTSSNVNTFDKHLDWSTTNNPDGVVLVHPPIDQGTCGACWAISAAGSVEASAARNIARDHYYFGLHNGNGSGVAANITATRQVESSTFVNTHLSIQELLDCDTFADQGCTGGNPLLSFFFIHRYGLVPWEEYPYTSGQKERRGGVDDNADDDGDEGGGAGGGGGTLDPTTPQTIVLKPPKFINSGDSPDNDDDEEDDTTAVPDMNHDDKVFTLDTLDESGMCLADKISSPIATVESWGLLHKDHEDLIELALKYIGPVAVGMNGGDPSFVHYGGGIFDDITGQCSQRANHALLITGYGEEEVETFPGYNSTIRYWIAKNSWGSGWGENGYIRIRRGPGGKHIPGVCGIARSPSVALGGQIRHDRTKPLWDTSATSAATRPTQFQLKYSVKNNDQDFGAYRPHPFCDSILKRDTVAYKQCSRISDVFSDHEAAFVGVVILVCSLMVIIPLTVAVLRRRRAEVLVDSLYLEQPSTPKDRSSFRATETTHLLTLKDMYASIRKSESGDLANDVAAIGGGSGSGRCVKHSPSRLRGRTLVMTDNTHDPFRLGDKLWETSRGLNGTPELRASFSSSSQEILRN